MILIADCGSTKIDWCLVDAEKVVKQIFTMGINAVMLTEEEIRQRLDTELVPELGDLKDGITDIYFYGAGCISPQVCGNVMRALRANIPTAETVEVYTDLLAAARALCGKHSGIACIMGTGSNSCYYDGKEIVANVSPLGFILGDEGSGAVLGRLFLGDVLKKQLPQQLCAQFLEEYGLDLYSIIQRVYKEPQPNRFLASVTPFLSKNIHEPHIHELVLGSFRAFFRRNIKQYPAYKSLKVNFVGSIAHHFREVLKEAADAESCTIGSILQSPMEGLVAFHCM